MKNLKMSAKLLLSFGIVAVLAAMIGLTSIVVLSGVDTAYSNVLSHELPGMYYMGDVQTLLARERATMRGMMINLYEDDYDGIDKRVLEMAEYESEILRIFLAYRPTIRDDQLLADFDALENGYKNYMDERQSFVDIAKTGDDDAANAQLDATESLNDDLLTKAEALFEENKVVADGYNETSTQEANSGMLTVIIILAVVLAVSIALGIYISSIISKPLVKMQVVLNQVGTTGSMSFSDEAIAGIEAETKYKDEIGTSIERLPPYDASLFGHFQRTGLYGPGRPVPRS